MLTIAGLILSVISLAYGSWRFVKKTQESERYEERLKQAGNREKGLKDAINTVQKNRIESGNNTDLNNLSGL